MIECGFAYARAKFHTLSRTHQGLRKVHNRDLLPKGVVWKDKKIIMAIKNIELEN